MAPLEQQVVLVERRLSTYLRHLPAMLTLDSLDVDGVALNNSESTERDCFIH